MTTILNSARYIETMYNVRKTLGISRLLAPEELKIRLTQVTEDTMRVAKKSQNGDVVLNFPLSITLPSLVRDLLASSKEFSALKELAKKEGFVNVDATPTIPPGMIGKGTNLQLHFQSA
ncbi:MAG: hypothetical protein HYR97_01955 [Candidatus Melainabacteria bacterium]|nr:hypothetical protein [Candidatus Melainabacteria bacterium]MBI3308353.1 hypothetical protein [Candidatus Melainabacteria bacterium]